MQMMSSIKRIATLRAMNLPGITPESQDRLEILVLDPRPEVTQFHVKGQYYNLDGSSASFDQVFPKADMYWTMCSFDVGHDQATMEGVQISIKSMNAEGAEV